MKKMIRYKFDVMTQALIQQTGSPTGIPEKINTPYWMSILPVRALPSDETMTMIWQEWCKKHVPEEENPDPEKPRIIRAHYCMQFHVISETAITLLKASGKSWRVGYPTWYIEATRAGAIAKWDSDRIGQEVLQAFGLETNS